MNADLFSGLGPWLLAASLRASLAAVAILVIQAALGRHLPARWRFGLWVPFVILLFVPVLPDSPLSLERLWAASVSSATTTQPAAASALSLDSPETVVGAVAADRAAAFPEVSGWTIAGMVWLCGFAGMVIGGFTAYRSQMRRIRQGATGISPALRMAVTRAAQAAGLRRCPAILRSGTVESPAVTGLWRPALLLPAEFPENLPDREASLILRHEALHLRHRDTVWDVVFWLLNAVHWFNPLVWFAFVRLRADRETARDAEILADAGRDERAIYGEALLRLQMPCAAPFFQAGFVGLVNGGRAMRRRIAGLSRHRRVAPAWHVAGLAVSLLIHLTIGASAQPKTPAAAPAPAPAKAPADAPAVAKAKSLIIDRAQFIDASIEEVVAYMRRKSMDADTAGKVADKKGLDFILKGATDAPVTLDMKNTSVYDVITTAAAQAGLIVGPAAGDALMIAPADEFKPHPSEPGKPTEISQRASKVVLDRIQFIDASLSEVAGYLSRKSIDSDPAKKGIKLELAPDLKTKPITLDLRNVTVLDLAKAVADVSGSALLDTGEALRFVPLPAKK